MTRLQCLCTSAMLMNLPPQVTSVSLGNSPNLQHEACAVFEADEENKSSNPIERVRVKNYKTQNCIYII